METHDPKPLLDRRLDYLEREQIRGWLDRKAWEISDERVLRRIGFERAGERVPEQEAADAYRNAVNLVLRRVGEGSGGLTWTRRRFQRMRNVIDSFPSSVPGQVAAVLSRIPDRLSSMELATSELSPAMQSQTMSRTTLHLGDTDDGACCRASGMALRSS